LWFAVLRRYDSPSRRGASLAGFGDFIAELKRRRVVRAVLGWGILSFAVLQIYEPVMHGLHLPEWTLTLVVVVLGVGFPATFVLAWIFDMGPGGVERTVPVTPSVGAAPALSRGWILALMLVGLGLAAAAPGVAYYLVSRGTSPIPTRAWVVGGLALLVAMAGLGRALTRHASQAAGAAPGPPPVASIAVLAFADMSPLRDQEYLADGVAEEILNALARVGSIKVIGRTSSFSFKGKGEDLRSIGQKLGVLHVLEGSLRKSGDRIRVNAQLIHVADGSHVWSESYDRKLDDIFELQDELALAVVSALKVKLIPGTGIPTHGRQPATSEAYENYLRGLSLQDRLGLPGMLAAQAAFENSVALDPGYGLAWSGLAMVLAMQSDWTAAAAQPGLQRRALAAADRGVELNPELAEAWARRGMLRMQIRWDWSGARSDIDRAVALNPRSPVTQAARARLHAALGSLPEAIAAQQLVVELDPLDAASWIRLHIFFTGGGQAEMARRALERAEAIDPTASLLLPARAYVELAAGRPEAALALTSAMLGEDIPEVAQIITALAQHALGRAAESQQALDQLVVDQAEYSAYQVAEINAVRGDRGLALDWLERALRQRDGGLVGVFPWIYPVKWNPAFRELHADPRFKALLRKMNLPAD
jgi:TolB-like protein/Flp pilus assembly protein TadD